jgi:hypothetical protein
MPNLNFAELKKNVNFLSFSYHIQDSFLHYKAVRQHVKPFARSLDIRNYRPALPQMVRPSCLYLGLGLDPYPGLCRDPGP